MADCMLWEFHLNKKFLSSGLVLGGKNSQDGVPRGQNRFQPSQSLLTTYPCRALGSLQVMEEDVGVQTNSHNQRQTPSGAWKIKSSPGEQG